MGQIEFITKEDCQFPNWLGHKVVNLPFMAFPYEANEDGTETFLHCKGIIIHPEKFGVGQQFEVIAQFIKERSLKSPIEGQSLFAPVEIGRKIKVIWGEMVGHKKVVMFYNDHGNIKGYVKHILQELDQYYGVIVGYVDQPSILLGNVELSRRQLKELVLSKFSSENKYEPTLERMVNILEIRQNDPSIPQSKVFERLFSEPYNEKATTDRPLKTTWSEMIEKGLLPKTA